MIRALLEPERVFAAYGLAQLAPRLFPLVRCYYAEREDGEGLVLHSAGGLGDAMLTAGNPAAVEAILSLHRGPRQNFATCALDHSACWSGTSASPSRPRWRGCRDRCHLRPAPPISDGHVKHRPAAPAHARTINRLYNTRVRPPSTRQPSRPATTTASTRRTVRSPDACRLA
jgi:hypothetical protein